MTQTGKQIDGPRRFWHYWVSLVAGGMLLGGALALVWRASGGGPLWPGVAAGVAGFLGLSFGIVGLVRVRRPLQPLELDRGGAPVRDRRSHHDASAAPEHWEGSSGSSLRKMSCDQLCTVLLQELDRALVMLRHAAAPADLAELTRLIEDLDAWAGQLALEKQNLELGARETAKVLGVRQKLVALEAKLVEQSGGDASEVVRKAARLDVEAGPREREKLFESCSERLVFVSRQFHDNPELREGLTSVARSLRVFFGKPKREKSSEEEAFAATVRMPDLPSLERIIQELKDLEPKQGDDAEATKLEPHKVRLKKLLASTGGDQAVSGWPNLEAMSTGLRAAVTSLETGEVSAARKHLDEVLEAVKRSPVGGKQ